MVEKWAIYAKQIGLIYEDCGEDVDMLDVVATFDSKEAAEEYIKASKLKRRYYGCDFKYKSLLVQYREPYVDIYKIKHPPHNPKVDWK